MDFSTLPQKKIKARIKELHQRTSHEIVSFDKEVEEMKKIHKQKIMDEQSTKDIVESISIAEEALYETLISNVELDAVLALSSKGFELLSFSSGKNSGAGLLLKKNGIDLNLNISEHTRMLIEESINENILQKG